MFGKFDITGYCTLVVLRWPWRLPSSYSQHSCNM